MQIWELRRKKLSILIFFHKKYFGFPPRTYLEFYTGDYFSSVPLQLLSQFLMHIHEHVCNVTSVLFFKVILTSYELLLLKIVDLSDMY